MREEPNWLRVDGAYWVPGVGFIPAPAGMRLRTFKRRVARILDARRKGYRRNRGWDQRWTFIARMGHDVDPRGCIIPWAIRFLRPRGLDDHSRRLLWER